MNLNDHVEVTENTIDQAGEIENSAIVFNPHPGKWMMKMTTKGFVFNREGYPELVSDDFANEFCKILEELFTVEIKRK